MSAETHDLGEGRTAGTLAACLSKNGFRVIRLPNLVHDHLGFLCAEQV